MRLSKILLMIFCLTISNIVWANYTVKIETRGIFYHNASVQTIKESQVCHYENCLYVSLFESNALNLDLEGTTEEIYQALLQKEQDELAFIYYQLEKYERQEH